MEHTHWYLFFVCPFCEISPKIGGTLLAQQAIVQLDFADGGVGFETVGTDEAKWEVLELELEGKFHAFAVVDGGCEFMVDDKAAGADLEKEGETGSWRGWTGTYEVGDDGQLDDAGGHGARRGEERTGRTGSGLERDGIKVMWEVDNVHRRRWLTPSLWVNRLS